MNVRGIQSRNDDGTLNEVFQLNPNVFCIQELHQKPDDLSDEKLYIKMVIKVIFIQQNQINLYGV